MVLRPYQSACVDVLWTSLTREQRALAVLPTAAGKTVIFHELLNRAAPTPNFRALILLNRKELVKQTFDRLSRTLDCGVFDADTKMRGNQIIIASLQSAYRHKFDGLKLIICDEAHNVGEEGMYKTFFDVHPTPKVLGFTATPYRNNELAVGPEFFFPKINFKRDLPYMIDNGFVVRPVCKALPKAFDTADLKKQKDDYNWSEVVALVSNETKVKGQVADAMERIEGRRKVVWVCATIDHAEMVKKYIPEASAIRHSKHLNDGGQKHMFEQTDVRHCVSVMMISEGWDYPPTDCIVMMRPTRSVKLAIQVAGRGLRLSPDTGKNDCLILDYGEVFKNCGPLDDPILVTTRKKKDEMQILHMVCEKCFTVMKKGTMDCPDCGTPTRLSREVDRLRNTLNRPDLDVDLLSKTRAPWVETVSSVEVKLHKSKSGNECVRIDYNTEHKWARSEWFTNHIFSASNFNKRSEALGIGANFNVVLSALKNNELVFVTNPPTQITLVDDGKFTKVKSLHFGEPSGVQHPSPAEYRAEDHNQDVGDIPF